MDKSVIKRLIIEKQRESETETRITGKSTEIDNGVTCMEMAFNVKILF